MPDLAPLAVPLAVPIAAADSRPPATEVLTSPKSMRSRIGTSVAEVQMPLYRKASNADEEVATARWRAVHDRDRAADGSFVFAVKTTGVYCRPSCPARRPKLQNVAFFPTGEAARTAGFRACKRCRPDETAGDRARRRRSPADSRRRRGRTGRAHRASRGGRTVRGASAAGIQAPDRPLAQAVCARPSRRAVEARARQPPDGPRRRLRGRLRLGVAPLRRGRRHPGHDPGPIPRRRSRSAYRLRRAQDGARLPAPAPPPSADCAPCDSGTAPPPCAPSSRWSSRAPR